MNSKISVLIIVLILFPSHLYAITTYEMAKEGAGAITKHIKRAIKDELKLCKAAGKKDDFTEIARWFLKHGGSSALHDAVLIDLKTEVAKVERGETDIAFRDLETDIIPSLIPASCRSNN